MLDRLVARLAGERVPRSRRGSHDGTRLKPGRDVLTAVQDGAAVLLDLRHETYIGLDEVGTRIWRHVESCADGAAIVDALAAEYDVPRDVLERDVRRFLDDLVQRGLAVPA